MQIERILTALGQGLANYSYLPPPPGYWPETRPAQGGRATFEVPRLSREMQQDFLGRMARWLPGVIEEPLSQQQLKDIEEGLRERAYDYENPSKYGYTHEALLRMVCSTQTAIWHYLQDGPDPAELAAIEEQLAESREAMMTQLLESWPDCPAQVREGVSRMANAHFSDLTPSPLWARVRSLLPDEEAADLRETLQRLIVLDPSLRDPKEAPLQRLGMNVSWVSSWARRRAREAGRAESEESRELGEIEQAREAELQAAYRLARQLDETDPGWRESRRRQYSALTRRADCDACAFMLAPLFFSARTWAVPVERTTH